MTDHCVEDGFMCCKHNVTNCKTCFTTTILDLEIDVEHDNVRNLLDDLNDDKYILIANQEELNFSIETYYKSLDDAYYMIHQKIDALDSKNPHKHSAENINLIN